MKDCCTVRDNKRKLEFKEVIVTHKGYKCSIYITYCLCCGRLLESQSLVETKTYG